jgi:myo-inositol-1-phosphate synthase
VPGDVEFVLGIDVDARKVGKDLGEAIFAAPNNTTVFYKDVPPSAPRSSWARSWTAWPTT